MAKRLRVIYEPSGRALEYGGLAVNLYAGCAAGCKYCYVPQTLHKTREEHAASTEPRKDVIKKLGMDLEDLFRDHKIVEGVKLFMCFTCDPYPEDSEITRKAIELCMGYDMPVRVLTKAPSRSERDWDLFAKHGVELGATFSCWAEGVCEDWEPSAEPNGRRLDALADAHNQGIYTWVSMEPVIVPEDMIRAIHDLGRLGCVDEVRVGMFNHLATVKREFPELVDRYGIEHIDWGLFAQDAVAALRQYPWVWRMKDGLAKLAPRGTPTNSDAAPMLR